MRTFIDEGKPMANMLRLVKQRKLAVNTVYVDTLLAGIEDTPLPAPTERLTAHVPHPAIAGQSAKNQDLLIDPLSDREIEVLQLVAEGLSNREIAEQLYITVGTAKTHTINIYRKLDVRSRTQAVARAQELGLF